MSQSLAKIYVHIVFSTKQRTRFIKPDIEKELFAYMGSSIKLTDSIPVLINGSEDHIHILALLHKTISLSKMIEEVKKNSSRWIKTKNPIYRDFSWQRGYAAFSVGSSELEKVKEYILNQKEHHKKFNFQEELITLLNKHEIEYDPQYIWD